MSWRALAARILLLPLLLMACTHATDRVRLRGEFANLEQGEFLIYSSDGALAGMDSLHVRQGRFTYELPLEGKGALHILYPNYSELTLFVNGGDELYIRGDARNLSEVTVSGSDENKLYTDFRRDIKGLDDKEVRRIAESYALDHPTTAVARYLLQKHFLLNEKAPRAQVSELYDSLLRANPDDLDLSALAPAVNRHRLLQPGNPLPPFTLAVRPTEWTDGKADSVISDTLFRNRHLLVMFWASWNGDSRNALYYARQHRINCKVKNYDIISYSLDVSESAIKDAERRDTITYISYCDFKAFASPLAQKWGICDIPYYIYKGPDGKIIASGSDWKHDIEPKVKELCW